MAELSAQAPLQRAKGFGRAGKVSRHRQPKGEAQQATAAGLDLLRVLGWLVLHDVAVPGDPETGGEGSVVDHLLAGPSGVYVVNTVNWPGAIKSTDRTLIVGREDRAEALAEVAVAAESVRAVLHGIPVAPMLCFERLEQVTGVVVDVALCASENILDLLTSQPTILDQGTFANASRMLGVACRADVRSPGVAGEPAPGTPVTIPVAVTPPKVEPPVAVAVSADPVPLETVEIAAAAVPSAEDIARVAAFERLIDGSLSTPAEPDATVEQVVEHAVEHGAEDAVELAEPGVAEGMADLDAYSAIHEAGAALWRELTDAPDPADEISASAELVDLVEVELWHAPASQTEPVDVEPVDVEPVEIQTVGVEAAAPEPGVTEPAREELEALWSELDEPLTDADRMALELEAEEERTRKTAERAANEARERKAREALERVEQEARRLAEQEARELADREARRRAELEASQRDAEAQMHASAREQAAAQERAEREAREQAEHEARVRAEAAEEARQRAAWAARLDAIQAAQNAEAEEQSVEHPVDELTLEDLTLEDLTTEEPGVEGPRVEEPAVEDPIVEELIVEVVADPIQDEDEVRARADRVAAIREREAQRARERAAEEASASKRRRRAEVSGVRPSTARISTPHRTTSPGVTVPRPVAKSHLAEDTGSPGMPMRALVHVALSALLIALVTIGAPRVPDAVSSVRGLFTTAPATLVGTAVSVNATGSHPDVTVLAGRPVDAQASGDYQPAKGEHLVAVPLRLTNNGLVAWSAAVAAGATVVDSLGATHRVAKGVRGVTGLPSLPQKLSIDPNEAVTGYVVFSVPAGRGVRSVTLGLSRSTGDAVTWQVAR